MRWKPITAARQLVAEWRTNAERDRSEAASLLQIANSLLAELRELRRDTQRASDIAVAGRPVSVDLDMSRGRLPVRVHATEPAGRCVEKVTVDGEAVFNAFYADEINGVVEFYSPEQAGPSMSAKSTARGYVHVHFKGHN